MQVRTRHRNRAADRIAPPAAWPRTSSSPRDCICAFLRRGLESRLAKLRHAARAFAPLQGWYVISFRPPPTRALRVAPAHRSPQPSRLEPSNAPLRPTNAGRGRACRESSSPVQPRCASSRATAAARRGRTAWLAPGAGTGRRARARRNRACTIRGAAPRRAMLADPMLHARRARGTGDRARGPDLLARACASAARNWRSAGVRREPTSRRRAPGALAALPGAAPCSAAPSLAGLWHRCEEARERCAAVPARVQ